MKIEYLNINSLGFFCNNKMDNCDFVTIRLYVLAHPRNFLISSLAATPAKYIYTHEYQGIVGDFERDCAIL